MNIETVIPYDGNPDELIVRDVLDVVTAGCDEALGDSHRRANDGRLWLPTKDHNLLMAKQTMAAPELSDIYPDAPKQGEPVEVVSRFWYGTHSGKINVWLRPVDAENSETFCIVTWLEHAEDGSVLIRPGMGGAGLGHGKSVAPTNENTRQMLGALYPGVDLANASLTDIFREGILQQIDNGADGYTHEQYEKIFPRSPKGNSEVEMLNGFTLNVQQINRTHLQGKDATMTVLLRQAFWGDEYGGIYDGMLERSVSIQKSIGNAIVSVSQNADVRLFNTPRIDGDRVVGFSAGPETVGLPNTLQALKDVPLVPDGDTLLFYKRLATEPIQPEDLPVF